jgi:hypothetical protein
VKTVRAGVWSFRAGTAPFALLFVCTVVSAGTAPQKTVTFDGESYLLAFTNAAKTVQEYLPAGQTRANWKKLVAVWSLHNLDDPADAAKRLGAAVTRANPKASVQTMEKNDKSEVLVQFFTWSKSKPVVAEFNLFRYIKVPGRKGLLAYQFSFRSHDTSPEAYTEVVRQNRERWVRVMKEAKFPAPD